MKNLVSIRPELFESYTPELLYKIGGALTVFIDSNFTKYPSILGNLGAFERNPHAMQSQIAKLHIALDNKDLNIKTWKRKQGSQRRSDNFLIFVSHWEYPNCYQIIDIISPDAHKRSDALIPILIETAEQFHALNKEQLSKLHWVEYIGE